MSETKKCPDCDSKMEIGFLPDSQNTVHFSTMWHPGEAVLGTVLGMKTGGVKIDRYQQLQTVAYRCPQCGLVRIYAEND